MYTQFKQFTLNESSSKKTYEYGCIMLFFDPKEIGWKSKLAKIDDDDLYTAEDGHGKETEPHTTILFGIHSKEANAQYILDKLKSTPPITVEVGDVTLFENDKYDVVKYEVKSEELNKLNKYFVKNLPNTVTFKDYTPHITLAYVKPGKGKKYATKESTKEYTSGTFVYSLAFDDFKQNLTVESEIDKNDKNNNVT